MGNGTVSLVMLNKKGFTLIEALVAILILSVLLVGLIPAFIRAYNVIHYSATRDVAVDIAQEMLEKARCADFSSLSNSSQTINRRIKKATIPYTVNTTITSLYGDELKAVTVKVFWTLKGQQKSYNATTVIGDIDG